VTRRQVLKRTVGEFQDDHVTDWAAALTYYGVLSIFPALLALVSIIGFLGTSATDALQRNLATFAPGPARSILSAAISNLAGHRGSASLAFLLGLLGALWAASGYVAAFMRASNVMWDMPEGRPIWKTVPVRLGVTLIVLVLLSVSAVGVVLTGGLARKVGTLLGVGSTAVRVWDLAKWPVLLLIAAGIVTLLYYTAPNVRHRSLRSLTPGAVTAIGAWIVVSFLFAIYVANFGSYNRTYGTIASAVVFLVWLWLTNIAVLFGAELNAELERGRRIDEGHPPDVEPYLEPRDTTKLDPTKLESR
jgi:membrane protein